MAKLISTYAKLNTNPPSDLNKDILSYIEKSENGYCDELMQYESRFSVFFQLSELRTGLLSWYPFSKSDEVLEIGAAFGSLTGLLCEKCGHVTVTERSDFRANAILKRWEKKENLTIYSGEWREMEFAKQFDYIILNGVLERVGNGSSDLSIYADYLREVAKRLKPSGKILFAVENRFGLRYFCGTAEPHTKKAFDGINNYRKGTNGRSFSKAELKKIISKANFNFVRFYYPLPDYKLPQLIYSDECLPQKNLRERLIPYYEKNDTLIASEKELYGDIIENGVFPFMANSFLVECMNGYEPSEKENRNALCDTAKHPIYAAISTDRGSKRSFATTIYNDQTVTKTPLYAEGMDNARQLYDNMTDLEKRGIPIVKHSLMEDGSLKLPYVSYPTLSNYIKDIFETNVEEVLQILDQIYEYILKSSEAVESHEKSSDANAMILALLDTKEEGEKETFVTTCKSIDFGPIIKKAYMELIPLNCFYNPDTKEYLFFDQEFVRENYPAKYVLFRAIHYIYCFTKDAQKIYPKQKMIERYSMEESWTIYEEEEKRFLDEVRNHKMYEQFYKWAAVDWKRIDENPTRLQSEGEKVADYQISDKMKKSWKVSLEILDEIDRICSKHGLTYFLVHGSLLGAVRHQGFIPWDDDLDIAMSRADYDKFLEIAKDELKEPLSLHDFHTEKDLFWGGFTKIRNKNTTGIEPRNFYHDGNQGLGVDILPYDVCTMNEAKFCKKEKKIRHCHRLFIAKIYGKDYREYADMKTAVFAFYRFLSAFYSFHRLSKKLDRAMGLYTDEASDEIAFFTGYYKHRRLQAEDFARVAHLSFENRKCPVPIGYENYLFMTLGKDYMKYPPIEERKPKHLGIYDPEVPFTEYKKLLCDTFDGCKGKKIILFGSGMMFEDYMTKCGSKYRPAFLVDNDENKWGRSRMGIEIRKPDAIKEISENKRHIIICSYYYREISKQLDEMGIHDYKVYVQKIEWILRTEQEKDEL